MIHTLGLLLCAMAPSGEAPLVLGKTFDLPNPGRFDVVAYDSKFHRVLAAHSEAKTLAVLDTETGKVQEIETGAINGVAGAGKANRIFVAGADNKLVVLDRETLKVTDTIPLTGPGDVIAVDSKREQVYVSHDDGTEDWVFDAKTLKLLGTVTIEEAPEFIEYDSQTDLIYQNIKMTNHLQVIDPETKKVKATWDTAPMKSPHGLVLDKKRGYAYSAGNNGKLITFELATGKQIAISDIATGTDQIAIDTKLQRLYCPGRGKLTILDISEATPKSLGETELPAGARSLTVDNKSHDVFVVYGDKSSAHIAQFKTK